MIAPYIYNQTTGHAYAFSYQLQTRNSRFRYSYYLYVRTLSSPLHYSPLHSLIYIYRSRTRRFDVKISTYSKYLQVFRSMRWLSTKLAMHEIKAIPTSWNCTPEAWLMDPIFIHHHIEFRVILNPDSKNWVPSRHAYAYGQLIAIDIIMQFNAGSVLLWLKLWK